MRRISAVYSLVFNAEPTLVTNSFFTTSQLKSRIQMLVSPQTNRRVLWKYALVVPLLVVLASLTAAREPMVEIMRDYDQPAVADLTVTGHVYSGTKNSAAPLPGAHVIIRNTNRGTDTDASGYFEMKDVPATATLVISYVGRKTMEIPAKKTKGLLVLLGPETTELPEITVSDKPDSQYSASDTSPVSTTAPSTEIFTVVEQVPEFPGGMAALRQYLASTLHYPDEARQKRREGRVFVQFIIDADGSIQNPRVLKGIGSGCDEEALRVVSAMPKWNPGRQNSRPVNVQFNLPIQFSLNDGKQTSPAAATTDSQPQSVSGAQPGTYTGVVRPNEHVPIEKMLIIIDGKEQPKGLGPNSVNIDNIQHINVLKGKEAEAKYGEKGRDGVIEITTKAKK